MDAPSRHDTPENTGAMSFEERSALLAAVAFQLECGVDEAVSETPTDWTTAFAAQSPEPQQPRATPQKRPPAAADEAGTPLTPAQERDLVIASARALAKGAGDLPSLNAALAGFDGSALKAGATTCVFSDGDPCARVMIIGEAPGVKGAFMGFGHHHIGLTGGPKTGRLLALMIAGKTPNADMSVYAPARHAA